VAKREWRIVWEPASQLAIIRILRNPNYSPHYVFGRTKLARFDHKPRLLAQSDWIIYPNHHLGLVTWEDWQRSQVMLDRNRRVKRMDASRTMECPTSVGQTTERGPILDGAALLVPRLLWCGLCGRPMKVRYDRRVRDQYLPTYLCTEMKDDKGVLLHRVQTERLDTVVVKAMLPALAAPVRDELRSVVAAYQEEQKGCERARSAQVTRAKAEEAEAERLYRGVDPKNDLVKAALEADWQAAKERLDRAKKENASVSPKATLNFGEAELDELVELSRRIEWLWGAPTTKNADRKRLLDAVLSRVEIQQYTEEHVDVKIVWIGGLEETYRVVRSKGIDAAVADLRAAGLTDDQAAEQLHSQGVIARGGGRVCRQVITKRVRRLGIQHRGTWRAGFLRIRELLELGWSSRRILEELVAHGPRHYHNAWNLQIVQYAIRKLQTGEEPLYGVRPLLDGGRRQRDAAAIWSLIQRRRAEKQPLTATADELNAAGFRPPRAERFTASWCAQAWYRRQQAHRRVLAG
jgi:hypothetical protein